jgi:Fe2+ transport system protein FeoA
MTLDSIPQDATARVSAVDWQGAHGLRLMEMGVTFQGRRLLGFI